MTFTEWLAELNAEAARIGYHGPLSTMDSLSSQTGEECWREFFDDDYTPSEALNADGEYEDGYGDDE